METVNQKLDQAKELDIKSAELSEYLNDMQGQVDKAMSDRVQWVNKLDENYQWRKGLVGRPHPNLPFNGASDIRYRLSEAIIRKLKPTFVMAVHAAPQVSRVIPYNPKLKAESATRLEHYYNFLYRVRIRNFLDTISVLVDEFLEKGKCVAKVTWDYCREPVTTTIPGAEIQGMIQQMEAMRQQMAMQTGVIPAPLTDDELCALIAEYKGWDMAEPHLKKRCDDVVKQIRANKEYISIIEDKVVRNEPCIGAIADLGDLIVPSNTTTIENAEWVAHDMKFTHRELRQKSVDNGGKYDNVEDIIEKVKAAQRDDAQGMDVTKSQDVAEGLSKDEDYDDMVTVRELYCWIPRKLVKRMAGKVEGTDDTPVRALITYCVEAGVEEGVMRVMEYPYDHGKWPFVEHTFNFSYERYYSGEGIPELINGVEREYNISKNAAINRNTIALSPPTLIWDRSGLSPSAHRMVGQAHMVKVPPAEAMHIPAYPDLSRGFEFDAQSCQMWAEQISGVSNVERALGSYSAPPTASQVDALTAPTAAIMQYELLMFFQFLGRIYTQVHELTKQYGFVLGEETIEAPNVDNPQEGVQLTKDDFDGEYMIAPGFDITRQNPLMEQQKLVFAYQMAFENPKNAPFVNAYDGFRDLMTQLIGPMRSTLWLKGRQDSEQANQMFLQMQAQAAMQMQMEGEGKSKKTKFAQMPQAGTGVVPNLGQ